MADPTLLETTTPFDGVDLGTVLDYLAITIGTTKANFTTEEDTLARRICNEQLNTLRRLLPEAKRFAEDDEVYTWVADDTSVELPADYALFRGLWKMDATDNTLPKTRITLVEEDEFLDNFGDGQSIWDELEDPICRIYRESDPGRQRVMHIYPDPAGGDVFKLLYWRRAEKLVNDGDALEAPPELQEIYKYMCAVPWLVLKGSDEDVQKHNGYLQAKLEEQRSPANREHREPRRARSFDEIGYPGHQPGLPRVMTWPDTPLRK
jgi:hypothetical protein